MELPGVTSLSRAGSALMTVGSPADKVSSEMF